jgi:cytochrome b subunit of formate dehydrogenase
MTNGNHRATIYYVVDLLIAAAFVLAGISGLVLLFAGPGGYQGGRNPRYAQEIFFLARSGWKDLHSWSGIAMAAGVLLHLVLHAKWIACMTKKLFKVRREGSEGKSCRVEG